MADLEPLMRPFNFTLHDPIRRTAAETARQALDAYFVDPQTRFHYEFVVQLANTQMEPFLAHIIAIRDVFVTSVNLIYCETGVLRDADEADYLQVSLVFRAVYASAEFHRNLEAQLLCIPEVIAIRLKGAWRIEMVQFGPAIDQGPDGAPPKPNPDGGAPSDAGPDNVPPPQDNTIAARVNKRPWQTLMQGTPQRNRKVTPRRSLPESPQ
eukprot:1520744-Rhodomonas_salina.1